MNRKLLSILCCGLFSAAAISAHAELIPFSATLDGVQEVPQSAPVGGASTVTQKDFPGAGSAAVTFDNVTNLLSWNVVFSGLIAPTVDAHFHGPTNPGDPAGFGIASPVRVSIRAVSGLSSPLIGSFDLDNLLNEGFHEANLLSGLWYINIHTTAFPSGEIRGQVLRVPEPHPLALLGIGIVALGLTRWRKR
jgi:CHRD domain/PEP-CTERM motif